MINSKSKDLTPFSPHHFLIFYKSDVVSFFLAPQVRQRLPLWEPAAGCKSFHSSVRAPRRAFERYGSCQLLPYTSLTQDLISIASYNSCP